MLDDDEVKGFLVRKGNPGFAVEKMQDKMALRIVQNGLITDWFLFAADRLRIAPPLIIEENELKQMCAIILQSINEVLNSAAFCKTDYTISRTPE